MTIKLLKTLENIVMVQRDAIKLFGKEFSEPFQLQEFCCVTYRHYFYILMSL